jgi:hypothetical protein
VLSCIQFRFRQAAANTSIRNHESAARGARRDHIDSTVRSTPVVRRGVL